MLGRCVGAWPRLCFLFQGGRVEAKNPAPQMGAYGAGGASGATGYRRVQGGSSS